MGKKNLALNQKMIKVEIPDRYDGEVERVFNRLNALAGWRRTEREKKKIIANRYRELRNNQLKMDLLYACSPYTLKYNKYDYSRKRIKTDMRIIKNKIG